MPSPGTFDTHGKVSIKVPRTVTEAQLTHDLNAVPGTAS